MLTEALLSLVLLAISWRQADMGVNSLGKSWASAKKMGIIAPGKLSRPIFARRPNAIATVKT